MNTPTPLKMPKDMRRPPWPMARRSHGATARASTSWPVPNALPKFAAIMNEGSHAYRRGVRSIRRMTHPLIPSKPTVPPVSGALPVIGRVGGDMLGDVILEPGYTQRDGTRGAGYIHQNQ